jgi:hypothetical protein
MSVHPPDEINHLPCCLHVLRFHTLYFVQSACRSNLSCVRTPTFSGGPCHFIVP